MKRSTLWLAVAVGVVGSAAYSRCGGCRKQHHDTQTDDALAYLPADSDIVLGFDVDALRGTSATDDLREELEHELAYRAFKRGCGFDPLTAIDRVTIGVHADGDHSTGVFVVNGSELGKLVKCADDIGDTVRRDGDIVFVTDKDGTAALELVDDHTLIGVFGEHPTKHMVDEVLRRDDSIRGRKEFASLYSDVDTRSAAWVVLSGTTLREKVELDSFQGIAASVKIDSRLTFEMRARFASAADAEKAFDTVGRVTRSVGGADFSAETDGRDILVKGDMPPKMLRSLRSSRERQ
jgi:hypothetical protein